jgi:hypothetical protein
MAIELGFKTRVEPGLTTRVVQGLLNLGCARVEARVEPPKLTVFFPGCTPVGTPGCTPVPCPAVIHRLSLQVNELGIVTCFGPKVIMCPLDGDTTEVSACTFWL